jgi:hypothetical protein
MKITPRSYAGRDVSHKANRMMRPYAVTPKSGAARTFIQGTDY